jgi:hypothetical protein
MAVICAIGMAAASTPALHEPIADPENSGAGQV